MKANYKMEVKKLNERPQQSPYAIEILNAILERFLRNSNCISKNIEKEFLLHLLPHKILLTTLLFRGSVHGWKAKDFHSRCDGKGPTISLFKVKETGECIGGYTRG